MAAPVTLPLPPDLFLWDSCIIRVTALDPTTGAVVPNVNVSDVTFEVEQTAGEAAALEFGPFQLVPGSGA